MSKKDPTRFPVPKCYLFQVLLVGVGLELSLDAFGIFLVCIFHPYHTVHHDGILYENENGW